MDHLWKMNWPTTKKKNQPDDKLINQSNGSIWWMNYDHHQSLTVSFGQSEFIFINKIVFSWITIRSIDQFKSCLISDISVRSIIIIFGFYAHTHMIFEQIFSTIFVFSFGQWPVSNMEIHMAPRGSYDQSLKIHIKTRLEYS